MAVQFTVSSNSKCPIPKLLNSQIAGVKSFFGLFYSQLQINAKVCQIYRLPVTTTSQMAVQFTFNSNTTGLFDCQIHRQQEYQLLS
jgi:hypothetical protein